MSEWVITDVQVNSVVAILTLGSLLLAYTTIRSEMRSKQVDVITDDHKRFDELQALRTKILVAETEIQSGVPDCWTKARLEVEATMFFDRFWSLQFDAYIAWLHGYVPSTVYTYWIFARWRELRSPSADWTLAGKTLPSTLGDISERWRRNPDQQSRQSKHVNDFIAIMERLRDHETISIEALLRELGPPRGAALTRKFFGGY